MQHQAAGTEETPREKLLDAPTATGQHRGPRLQQPPDRVPALTIVSHPLGRRAGERVLLEGLAAGRAVSLSRAAPDFVRSGTLFGEPLADPFISRTPFTLEPLGSGGLRLSVPGGGTRVRVGEVTCGTLELGSGELTAGLPIELAGRVVLWLHLTDPRPPSSAEPLGMLGESPGIRRVREHVARIADLNVPVLIRGETGTGKELVARALHERSPRRDGPFVSVNLGAIPKELAAAELFGVQKGAFTGALRDREGFFRAARGGTLFLDEVGEAPPEVQVMLLRVLETGEMYPVGGETPVRTDVRLIAATDANLEQRIQAGHFKAPLLHRLAGYDIWLPPLRERREDIGLLFHHFAREELEPLGEAHRLAPADPYSEPWMPAALALRLVRYAWPGNIRQLRNLARQLVIASRGQPQLVVEPRLAQELDAAAAPLPARTAAPGMPAPSPAPAASSPDITPAPRRKPADVTEQELIAALREHAWDVKAAADRLGIPRSSIYDLIERSPNIRIAGHLTAEEITRCYRDCQGDLDAMAQRLEVSKRALSRRVKELGLKLDGP